MALPKVAFVGWFDNNKDEDYIKNHPINSNEKHYLVIQASRYGELHVIIVVYATFNENIDKKIVKKISKKPLTFEMQNWIFKKLEEAKFDFCEDDKEKMTTIGGCRLDADFYEGFSQNKEYPNTYWAEFGS